MRTGKQHLFHLIVVAFVALAAVPTVQAAGPDDRALYRGASATLSPLRSTPDDRAYYRGTSPALAPKGLGPDDRAFARSTPTSEPATAPAAAVQPSSFDWSDAFIGGTLVLGFALLAAGAVLIAVRHRTSVRTA